MPELTHTHNGRTTTIELFPTPKAARRAVRDLRATVRTKLGRAEPPVTVQLHGIVAVSGGYAIAATVITRTLFGVGGNGVELDGA